MPLPFAKFFQRRQTSASKKYAASGVSEPRPDFGVATLLALGGRHGAVSHQQDTCAMLAEYLGGTLVLVGCESADEVQEMVEEAVQAEVEHLINYEMDDTRSVATMRSGPSPASVGDQAAEPSPAQLVLLFPLLAGTQTSELIAGLRRLCNVKLFVKGVICLEQSIEECTEASLARQIAEQQATVSDPTCPFALRVPLGLNALETFETLRVAGPMLCSPQMIAQRLRASCTVLVSEPAGGPPRPGEEMVARPSSVCDNRCASRYRLAKCRTAALQAVRTITANLVETECGEERYRVLVSNTQRFIDTLGSSEHAMRILFNCGFHEEDECGRRCDVLRLHPSAGLRTAAAWDADDSSVSKQNSTSSHRMILAAPVARSALKELQRTLYDVTAELAKREAAQVDAEQKAQPRKR